MILSEKWKTILHSSRFRAIVANVLFIFINELLGRQVSIEVVGAVTALIITFAIGRTFKEDRPKETTNVILKKLKAVVPDGDGVE